MIRKLLITMLTFLSLVSGSALILSYAKTVKANGHYYSSTHYLYETRGLMITPRRGRATFYYSYPLEIPVDPKPTLVGTARCWFHHLNAKEVCPDCHCRFVTGQACPWTHKFFHHVEISPQFPPNFDAKWNYNLVSWATYKIGPNRASWITINLWFPFALFAPYPIFAFIRGPLRRRRRRRIGHCTKCGYNLQGNESGVCPECGMRVVSANSRA